VRYTLPTSQAQLDDEAVESTPTPEEDNGTTDDDGAGDDPVEAEVDPQTDLVVTISYHDFGTEVDIATPDEEDVVDLDEEELRRTFGDTGGSSEGVGNDDS
jgi:hypothetical protein